VGELTLFQPFLCVYEITMCERVFPRASFARCYGDAFVCVALDWLAWLWGVRRWFWVDGWPVTIVGG
jgi:hypothetical protein